MESNKKEINSFEGKIQEEKVKQKKLEVNLILIYYIERKFRLTKRAIQKRRRNESS